MKCYNQIISCTISSSGIVHTINNLAMAQWRSLAKGLVRMRNGVGNIPQPSFVKRAEIRQQHNTDSIQIYTYLHLNRFSFGWDSFNLSVQPGEYSICLVRFKTLCHFISSIHLKNTCSRDPNVRRSQGENDSKRKRNMTFSMF